MYGAMYAVQCEAKRLPRKAPLSTPGCDGTPKGMVRPAVPPLDLTERGYALDDEELEEGIPTLSTPIRHIDGNVIAALSVPHPANGRLPERMPEIVNALVEAANAFSAHGPRPKPVEDTCLQKPGGPTSTESGHLCPLECSKCTASPVSDQAQLR